MKRPAATAFVVRADGWIAGVFLRRDDVVQLTPEQAQFENVAAAPEPKPKPSPSRKPRARKSGGQS